MNAKKGSILFYSESGMIAERIKKKTNGLYNHVEIVIADNVALEVRPKNIGLIDLTHKHLKSNEFVIIGNPAWKDMEAGIKKALDILDQAKGYSLGNITAWWSGIERLRKKQDQRFEDDDWIICSELVADSLEAGGVKKLLDFPNSFYSPTDILRGFEFLIK